MLFLVRDARLMDYDYMENPLSLLNYEAYVGYALSYKLAYEEIRYVTLKSRAKFACMAEFEFLYKTGTGIHTPRVVPTVTRPQILSLEMNVPICLVYAISSQTMLNSAIANSGICPLSSCPLCTMSLDTRITTLWSKTITSGIQSN
jgi:hypothetical protein